MTWEQREPDDPPAARSPRREAQQTDRITADFSGQGDPVNPNWRSDRGAGRSRKTQTLPSSRQEFLLWLQYGGWRFLAAIVLLALVAVVLIILSRPPGPLLGNRTEPEAVPEAQEPIPPLSVSPEITTTATLVPTSPSGARFRVFNTNDEGLFLRSDPNTDNQPLKTLPEGTVVTVIGEDFVGPDRVWKHVRDPDGSEGWVAADFLQSVP